MTEDIVSSYLRQMGEIPMLSPEEERQLAVAIKDGREANEALASAAALSPEERRRLEATAAWGEDARQRMIEANLRLVVSIARRYRRSGLPFEDLIQEGNIGLMRAVEKFEPERGLKFSTYATQWIQQSIGRYVENQSRLIRVPVHRGEEIRDYFKAVQALTAREGREPNDDEIIAFLAQQDRRWTHKRLAAIRDAIRVSSDVSLNRRVSADGDTEFGEFVPASVNPAEEAERALIMTALRSAIALLPPRERRIIELRYGLLDGRLRTLEEVGTSIGLTRERVRQIEVEIFKRLRGDDGLIPPE